MLTGADLGPLVVIADLHYLISNMFVCSSSLNGLGFLSKLEHLDVSNNFVKVIEGIEMLSNLKSLLISNNEISTTISLRSLSCNRYLSYLGH